MNIPVKIINKKDGKTLATEVSARKLLEVCDEADLLQELTMCTCVPVGETNLVECNCDVAWEDSELLIGDEIKEENKLFVSERNIPLITQVTNGKRMLTAEDYEKWYSFYLINEDGKVEDVYENEHFVDGWRDHCIVPDSFKKMAESLNVEYDYITWQAVLTRYKELMDFYKD